MFWGQQNSESLLFRLHILYASVEKQTDLVNKL